MEATKKAPNVSIDKFKRTKIVATTGPATHSYEKILALIKSGVNVIRLNFSHCTYEEAEQRIAWARKAAKEYGKPVAIIQDLQGPKLRLGDFDGVIPVKKGQQLQLALGADYSQTGVIPVQYDLSKKVKRGERIYLFDGKVCAVVSSVKEDMVLAEAQNEGILIKRKGINLPDTDFAGDIITKKDRQDITWGSERDIDYVAMSFVQSASDIITMRRILHSYGSKVGIIAKMETRASVDNMAEIVAEADAVMVARGDLAVETPLESVPVVQRQIISLGMQYGTPTIVATQMLASMVDAPEPTRAEVSDVATAVILGADAVMLSEETASGSHPLEAVRVMKRIILYTQANGLANLELFSEKTTKQGAICSAILDLANSIGAQAIVAETASGATAINIACRRPSMPVIAVTSNRQVAQKLALVYGVKSYVRPIDKYAATKLTDWLRQSKVLAKGDMVVTASGQHPGVVGTTDTIKVRVLE